MMNFGNFGGNFGQAGNVNDTPIHAVVWREVYYDEPWHTYGSYMCFPISAYPRRPNVLMPMLFVHKDGFKLKLKSAGELDPAELKRLRRKAEESLTFCDEISFFLNDVEVIDGCHYIKSFERRSTAKMKPYTTRNADQFLVDGVMDVPENSRLYTFNFGMLPLHISDTKRAYPNIVLKAWITLHEDKEQLLFTASFVEFEALSEDNQYLAGEAPWNLDSDKYALTYHSDSDEGGIQGVIDARGIEDNERNSTTRKSDVQCIYTGPLTAYSEKYKTESIIIPFLKKGPNGLLKIGERIVCNVIWQQYEKCWLACSWRYSSTDGEKPVPAKRIGLFDAIEIGVKGIEGHPGIFLNEKFGLVDDPENRLAMYHLTRYKDSVCRVYVKDDGPSRLGHFRILEVEPDKLAKIQTFIATTKIELTDLVGIIVSKNGNQIFAAKHAPLMFKFDSETCPQWSHFEIGTRIRFNAKSADTYGLFLVISYEIMRVQDEIPHVIRNDGSVWFRTKCAWERLLFPRLLVSQDFGLIDDVSKQFPEKFQPNKEYEFWVTKSLAHSTIFPTARTHYNAVWRGPTPPEDNSIAKIENTKPLEQPHTNISSFAEPMKTTMIIPESLRNVNNDGSDLETMKTQTFVSTTSRFSAPSKPVPKTAASSLLPQRANLPDVIVLDTPQAPRIETTVKPASRFAAPTVKPSKTPNSASTSTLTQGEKFSFPTRPLPTTTNNNVASTKEGYVAKASTTSSRFSAPRRDFPTTESEVGSVSSYVTTITSPEELAPSVTRMANISNSSTVKKDKRNRQDHDFIKKIQDREMARSQAKRLEAERAPSVASELTYVSLPLSTNPAHQERLTHFGIIPNSMGNITALIEKAMDIIETKECCGGKCVDDCAIKNFFYDAANKNKHQLKNEPIYDRILTVLASFM